MYKYKNESGRDRIFRAGEGGKKKVYSVKPGKSVELPVEISFDGMVLENGEMKKSKKNGKGDE